MKQNNKLMKQYKINIQKINNPHQVYFIRNDGLEIGFALIKEKMI